MTKNTATSQSATVSVTIAFCQNKFDQARANNLKNGHAPFEAATCAANWAYKKYARQLELEADRLAIEEYFDSEVEAVRPEPEIPSEQSIRDHLSNIAPETIRSAVYEVEGVLCSDTRIEAGTRAALIVLARSFLPVIDEAWISRKFESASNLKAFALNVIRIIKSDTRLDNMRKSELFGYLQMEIAKVSSEDEALSFIAQHTRQRVSEIRQLAPMRQAQSSQPLLIEKSKEPVLKTVVCAPNPIGEIEHEIKKLKTSLKEQQRSLRDGLGGTKERCNELIAQLTQKEADRAKLLKAKKDQSTAERQARKAKKTPVESKKSKAA